jgi:peptide/nickel transport system substrate-binding protein
LPMTVLRSWRIFYLIVIQLAQKYTKALGIGFLAGFLLSLGFWQIYPFIAQQWLTPVIRIGIVGDYTPNSLPLSIQKDISMGLTTEDTDGSPLPGLASTWTATDSGKIFTFYLKSNLKWQDGKTVQASDVNYNIRNVTFTVVDPVTLKATLKTAYSPLPSLLSKPLFQAGLRGFGKYKVAGIKLNGDKVGYIKLVPTEQGSSPIKAKEYRFYRTEATAILAFKLGEIDQLDDLTSKYDVSSWGVAKITERVNYNRIVSIFFNLDDQMLQDKSLRHALAFAVPPVKYERAYSPIAKTSWAYTDKVKKYDADFDQAKKLLATAKIASESASLVLTTFSQYADFAQTIADSWTKLGLSTKVKIVNTVPSDYQILLSAQDVPPDPDQYPFWHSTQTQTNITSFANVKIDKLLEDARQEIDTESRKKIYVDFQRRIVEEAPAVFLYYPTIYSLKRH